MKNKLSKFTVIGAYCYLIIPYVLFVIGYCKWWISAPITIIVLTALVMAIRTTNLPEIPLIGKKQYGIIAMTIILSVIWVYLSGIGKPVPQNMDQQVRNGLYEMLVNYRWPVERGIFNADFLAERRALVYYIGFWLPSAVVGKIWGIQAGYYAQFVWAVLGVILVCSLMWHWKKEVVVAAIIFLIFFGGLDYLGFLRTERYPILGIQHLEWHAGPGKYQYSSMTTQLGYVFNQAVPTWVATALIMNLKDKKNIVFIWGAVMLHAAFPFIGLLPVVVFFMLKNVKDIRSDDKMKRILWLKEVFSYQNVMGGGVIGITTFLYFIGNESGKKIGVMADTLEKEIQTTSTPLGNLGSGIDWWGEIGTYCLFIILEIGVYSFFVAKRQRKNALFYLIVVSLLLIPFVKVGDSADFCMRASIPLLFILMMYIWEEWRALKWYTIKKISLFIVLGIASITAVHELYRVVWYLQEGYQDITRSSYEILGGGNFSSQRNGVFFEMMCKENNNKFSELNIHYAEEPEGLNYRVVGATFSVEENSLVSEALHLIFDGWVDGDLIFENKGMLDDTTVNTVIEVNGEPIDCLSYGKEAVILPKELFESERSNVITIRMNKQVKLYAVDSFILKYAE